MFSITFTMKEARRARLIELFNTKYGGDRARFMRAVGLTKGRITQLFDEEEPFGEIAARRLAERLSLPGNYFERSAPVAEERDPGVETASFAAPPPTPEDQILLRAVKIMYGPEWREQTIRSADAATQRALEEQSRRHPRRLPERKGDDPGDSNLGGLWDGDLPAAPKKPKDKK